MPGGAHGDTEVPRSRLLGRNSREIVADVGEFKIEIKLIKLFTGLSHVYAIQ
jgi:hypothetical protein